VSATEPSERARTGEQARVRVPLEAHASLAVDDRPSPLTVLHDQAESRVPELVPLRHSRMLVSPFTFYRGAAAIMAADLASTPVSGLDTQLCGDAHLSNFGVFASPERQLVFDLNDFDETYVGPWEWDLKRLASSLVVAGRENGFSAKQTRKVVTAMLRRYRDAVRGFAELGNLALWYSQVDVAAALGLFGSDVDPRLRRRVDKVVTKARSRDHLRALDKLTAMVDGRRRIVADPPLIVPVEQLAPGARQEEVAATVHEIVARYADSLDPGHRALVSSFTFVDMARKVVGVGSVGTRCWIVLMRGRDDADPLFLQVKEAQQSVLAPHLGPPTHDNQGERVVVGQRLMQASSDPFLGWDRITGLDGRTRDFYVRQLHDWKGSSTVETMTPQGMRVYGELCGWTLARGHARTGDRIALAAYLGDDEAAPAAFCEFAHAYADLNERDHAAFADAVRTGEIAAADTP
jgi:uncharacterized protein (DUF2252 family)